MGGQKWLTIIEKEIKSCDFFIALLSHASVSKRGIVQKEMREALKVLETIPEDKVFIIPVRLENCEPSFPVLREIHWIDLFPEWDLGVSQILRAVDQDRGSADLSERQTPFDLAFASWSRTPERPSSGILRVSEVLHDVLAQFDAYVEARNLTVRLFDTSNGAQVVADRELMSLSLSNILHNAVKYSYSSSKGRGVIRVSCGLSGKFIRVGVENIGLAIDPGDIRSGRIFERGFRTHASVARGVGLGTGLFVARHAMESFGGSIRVESRPLRKALATADPGEPFATQVVLLMPVFADGDSAVNERLTRV